MLDTPLTDMNSLRPRWMAVLARSTQDDLKHYFDQNGGLPDHHIIDSITEPVLTFGRARRFYSIRDRRRALPDRHVVDSIPSR